MYWPMRCLVALMVGLVVLAAGADTPSNTSKRKTPTGPQRVTVTKVGGKVLSGTLTATDLDGIHVQYGPKAEVLDIPWSDVKSLSNGMTHAKFVAEWKTEHANQLCDKCHGERFVQCPDCKGTGIDPKQKTECATCKGSGSAGPCPTKGCVDGKIDCPQPCLKLSQGQWKLKNGEHWREFRGRNGDTYSWSEHHLGELIVTEKGEPVNKGKCPTCNGTGKIGDPVCKGTGHKACPDCKGVGFTGPACPTCDHGRVKCQECKGTGLKPGAS